MVFVVALGTCLLRPWRKSVRPLAQRAALDVGPRKRCCVTTARVRFQAHSADGRVLSRKRRARAALQWLEAALASPGTMLIQPLEDKLRT